MQSQPSFSVDDAVAFLFPEDNYVVTKHKIAAFTEDIDSYLAVLPSDFWTPANTDASVFEDEWDIADNMNTAPCQAGAWEHRTESAVSEISDASSDSASQAGTSPAPRKEKKRLIAWTPEEHKRFVFALEQLRTEDTEAYNRHGKKTRGLGPGIAELIALAVRTRTAAQVRSHAQKYFAKQRKEMGLPLW